LKEDKLGLEGEKGVSLPPAKEQELPWQATISTQGKEEGYNRRYTNDTKPWKGTMGHEEERLASTSGCLA
jgi:hypothetical protein